MLPRLQSWISKRTPVVVESRLQYYSCPIAAMLPRNNPQQISVPFVCLSHSFPTITQLSWRLLLKTVARVSLDGYILELEIAPPWIDLWTAKLKVLQPRDPSQVSRLAVRSRENVTRGNGFAFILTRFSQIYLFPLHH